ncbi:hypothetical protein BGZ92_005531 [Podila epicladia]|nr:hypothetical protein BGZ92_005531 [Podila epicladia]
MHHLIEEERPIVEVVLDEAREVVLEEVEVDMPKATVAKSTMARRTRRRMRVMMALQGRATLDGKSAAMRIDTLNQMQQDLTLSFAASSTDQKKTFDPAAYFRFKSEKDVENQDAAEESQQARKLLEVRLDDVEKALMTLSIKDRLFLRESDAKSLDRDIVGKVSFSTGKPIVPKLVRGQAASDILIKPSGPQPTNMPAKPPSAYSGVVTSGDNKSRQALQASLDEDLDDLLDITKSYGKAKTAPAPAPPTTTPTKIPSPRTGSPLVSSTASPSTFTSTGRKALPPLLKKKGPPRLVATDDANDEEWLDSVLG